MKRLVTSDWQLCDNPRDRYRTDLLENYFKPLISKYQPDQFIFLGDLTEAKDNHPASLVNEIVEFFDELGKCCDIVFLQGNHDFLHKGHPYFKFLQGIGAVDWIDTPTVKDNCLFLPHTRDYKKDWKNVDLGGHEFIFAHNIFEGVKANGQSLSGIPTSIFPSDAFVISGDIHEPQGVGPIVYVGSPSLCDFGDSYSPRVILISGHVVQSIKVKGPQKRLINVDWGEEEGIVFHHLHGINPGDICKFQVNLQPKHVASWPEIRGWVDEWAVKRNFIPYTIQPVVAYVQGERQQIVKGEQKSDRGYLEAFIKRNGVDDATADIGKKLLTGENHA